MRPLYIAPAMPVDNGFDGSTSQVVDRSVKSCFFKVFSGILRVDYKRVIASKVWGSNALTISRRAGCQNSSIHSQHWAFWFQYPRVPQVWTKKLCLLSQKLLWLNPFITANTNKFCMGQAVSAPSNPSTLIRRTLIGGASC